MNPKALILLATLAAACSHVPTEDKKHEVLSYSGVGRIDWSLPKSFSYVVAVPHFTAGPRLKCTRTGEEECEIEVFPWDPGIDQEERRTKLLEALAPALRDSVEGKLELKKYGARTPVEYVSLTDKRHNEQFRLLLRGFYVTGPALIRFEHLSNDSGRQQRFLELIHSAKPVDALPLLAWKLGDYVYICNQRHARFAEQNQRAFDTSIFRTIDPTLEFVKTAPSSTGAEEIEQQMAAQRAFLAEVFDKEPVSYGDAVCGRLSTAIASAQASVESQ